MSPWAALALDGAALHEWGRQPNGVMVDYDWSTHDHCELKPLEDPDST